MHTSRYASVQILVGNTMKDVLLLPITALKKRTTEPALDLEDLSVCQKQTFTLRDDFPTKLLQGNI